MQTYLVTGGAGFIGSNFIHYLLTRYHRDIVVVNVDKLTYAGNIHNLDGVKEYGNYVFIQADINDLITLEKVFARYRPDVVVNFAAETHVDRSISSPRIFVETNVLGTQALLDMCLKYPVKKFVQVSTDEVYGSLGKEGVFTEDSPLRPSSPYASSKAAADLILQAYHQTYGLPFNITRCTNNYGPLQMPEKLIPLVISRVLDGMPVPVYGEGTNIREWIFVEDHCRALEEVIHKGVTGEVYNIGSGCEIENLRLVKLVIDMVKELLPAGDRRKNCISHDLIELVADRKGHDFRYAVSSEKIRQATGWQPAVSFEEGIRFTVNWYLTHEEWVKKARQRL
ncbi:dTDP-glucose 4,6-dehydratase [Thermosyntropha lipolytica DSM 11003]|uniref:dTDP-glucose 4,6-dehydratase n=1 Tax=Thermosyntropha lipolytica DSM 11003 TaxID=1123382 RepID=A0A1M5LKS7_9FIRM|nr:dTDP-glucose 4,6-dehydratase [Thermosyntropha lipolytica]SHG65637.1 dTDP-glucose 4,6-dehydratase [Thermosyntropha lipolytica DSM 11003]